MNMMIGYFARRHAYMYLFYKNVFVSPRSKVITLYSTTVPIKTVRELLNVDKSILPLECRTRGWVRNIRKRKNSIFLDLVDGTCLGHQKLQIVLEKEGTNSDFQSYDVISLEGCLVESLGRQQSFEFQVKSCSKLSSSNPKLWTKVNDKLETLRLHPHLRVHNPIFASLLRIRSNVQNDIHTFLKAHNFYNVNTPILTGNDCEGAGQVFQIDNKAKSNFFKQPTYLTVSSQLHLEAMLGCLERVYTVGPTFRAENSRTRLHLSEFEMVEVELGFVDSIDDLITLAECLILTIGNNILLHCSEDAELWPNKVTLQDLAKPVTRLTYTEAVKVLQQNGNTFSKQITWGEDLNSEHETFLVEHCGGAVAVIRYPTVLKPFYMKSSEPNGETVENFDLLFPYGGEVCGGSLREDKSSALREKLDLLGLNESLEWYLELRELGSIPHGGFGLGLDRLMLFFLGVKNLRDIVPFPRWTEHCLM